MSRRVAAQIISHPSLRRLLSVALVAHAVAAGVVIWRSTELGVTALLLGGAAWLVTIVVLILIMRTVLEPLERLRVLDDRLHLGFDPRKILFADGGRQVEVVVEPVLVDLPDPTRMCHPVDREHAGTIAQNTLISDHLPDGAGGGFLYNADSRWRGPSRATRRARRASGAAITA